MNGRSGGRANERDGGWADGRTGGRSRRADRRHTVWKTEFEMSYCLLLIYEYMTLVHSKGQYLGHAHLGHAYLGHAHLDCQYVLNGYREKSIAFVKNIASTNFHRMILFAVVDL